MSLFAKLFKFIQAEAHAMLSVFEDPIKMTEQGIRDLKDDFDEAMKSVAQIKAIAIGTKKEIEAKQKIADDYEQKAMIILKKAQNGEIEDAEADRLAGEALKKKQAALNELTTLKANLQGYNTSLEKMEGKVLELKNHIKKAEEEYNSLKARAAVAKTTKKINKQLSTAAADSTMAMLEDMKQKIQEEENLAEAYGEVGHLETSVDDEINKAIGTTDVEIQASLAEMKRKLIGTQTDTPSETESAPDGDIENMKKELDN